MQILTFADGKLGIALIPDRLRLLLNTDAAHIAEHTSLVADYQSESTTSDRLQLPHDRLSIFSLPKHADRSEYFIRFQRGRASWSVLVLGVDNLMEFDRRYVQSFIQNLRAVTSSEILSIKNNVDSLTSD